MIYWFDSFMAIFGFKRPEVWEAERKEHDVTFPAPHAFPADMKPPPGYRFKEPRNRANVRSKRSNVRSKRDGNRSQSAESRNEPLTYVQLQGNGVLCHQVHVLWQSGGTDAEIAEIVGVTIAAVKELRRRKRWVRNSNARIARQLHNDKSNVRSKKANVRSKQAKKAKSQLQSTNKEE